MIGFDEFIRQLMQSRMAGGFGNSNPFGDVGGYTRPMIRFNQGGGNMEQWPTFQRPMVGFDQGGVGGYTRPMVGFGQMHPAPTAPPMPGGNPYQTMHPAPGMAPSGRNPYQTMQQYIPDRRGGAGYLAGSNPQSYSGGPDLGPSSGGTMTRNGQSGPLRPGSQSATNYFGKVRR